MELPPGETTLGCRGREVAETYFHCFEREELVQLVESVGLAVVSCVCVEGCWCMVAQKPARMR